MFGMFSNKVAFALAGLSLVVALNVSGILTASMMGKDGAMHDCPYMGIPTLCAMTPLEHLSKWQEMSATTAVQLETITLLLLVAVILWPFVRRMLLPKREGIPVPRFRYRERIFDPLRLAFARGILHTKAY